MTQHQEHDLQCQIVAWAHLHEARYPPLEWLHATPNSAAGNPRRGAWFREEGVKAGVLDLLLPYAAHGYHMFYLEIKRPGALNEVKPRQKEFMTYCEAHCILAQVHDNFETATEALVWYLEGWQK
jgi:hypothetical protein